MDTDQGKEEHRFGTLGVSSGLAFSRDGNLLAVASQDKEVVSRCGAWPAGSRSIPGRIPP